MGGCARWATVAGLIGTRRRHQTGSIANGVCWCASLYICDDVRVCVCAGACVWGEDAGERGGWTTAERGDKGEGAACVCGGGARPERRLPCLQTMQPCTLHVESPMKSAHG